MTIERLLRLGFVMAAIAWAVALPLAAAIAASPHARAGEYLVATLAYTAGGIICHQQSGRSFHLFGVQLPVCARCTGIYLGAALASIASAGTVFRRASATVGAAFQPRRDAAAGTAALLDARAILIASCVPIALTLVFEWTTGITPSNTIRALSGLPLGAAVAWVIAAGR